MSDKFQLLLKQIRFPEDHDAFKEIKDFSVTNFKRIQIYECASCNFISDL